MSSHHPEKDLLLSYSAGSLGEGWSLAVATHLAYCPTCRSVVEDADDLGGVFLADETPDMLSPGSFDAMLKKIKEPVGSFHFTGLNLNVFYCKDNQYKHVSYRTS